MTERLPVCRVEEWTRSFPWVCAGTTERFPGGAEPNFGLFTTTPANRVMGHWEALLPQLGFSKAVHSRQVHGAGVRVHDTVSPGLHIAPPGDGHATRALGVLLAVAIADCVPIFVVDPATKALALLHGGWRGVAAGILEAGTQTLVDRFGCGIEDLHVHLGPCIGADRYEVGSEVFRALDLPDPGGPALLDLRGVLVDRAVALGVPRDHISVSERCTADPDSPHFSHRAGDSGRQIAVLGIPAS